MASNDALLVEGTDDEHVLYALLKHHAVPPDRFKVVNKKGISNVLETLEVELLASDRQYLGIIVDADEHLPSRWQSLRTVLRSSGYRSVPHEPDADGTVIVQPGLPVVGGWIMPDNRTAGMLEHFMQFLVPSGDTIWDHAVKSTEAMQQPERRFQPQHLQKAMVHAWLAWQKEPGSPLGQAITKRYLDADAPHAHRLIGWIRRLFQL